MSEEKFSTCPTCHKLSRLNAAVASQLSSENIHVRVQWSVESLDSPQFLHLQTERGGNSLHVRSLYIRWKCLFHGNR